MHHIGYLCYNYYMDTTVRNLDEHLYRTLRARAVTQRRNVGDLVNEAMRLYLARPELSPTRPRSTLRDLRPEPFPEGNELLSAQIDDIVYGDRER